jgi:FkbM family methyltransferase
MQVNKLITFKRILGQFLAKLFARSFYITQLSRRIVQIYDNDQNNIFKENGELKLLTHLTRISNSESIFFDVGANVGDYSIELIKGGITGKLFLVDPLKKNLNIARKKLISLNFNNFELLQCALSNSTEKVIFYTNLDDNLSGHDSLYDMSLIGYTEKTIKTEVDVKTLDEVLLQFEVDNIYFLKIDVEGNEFNVMRGASNLLARGAINFMQFEFGNAAKAARVYLHDIVFLLESNQYKIYVIKPRGLLPLEFTPFTEMRYSYINLLAVHVKFIHKISNIVISD